MAYVSDELSGPRRRAFEEHLGGCPNCVAYLDSDKATIELGKAAFALPDERVPPSVPEGLVRAILRARTDEK